MAGFVTAIAIEGQFVGTALSDNGVKIFSIDFEGQKFKLEASFNKTDLKLYSTNIQDLSYDFSRKNLFILDHHTGVIPLHIAKNGSGLSAKRTSSIISVKGCNVIYYDATQEELYVNCRELHKYRVKNWPLFDETILPRQEISIR